jgi:hypothetical protein
MLYKCERLPSFPLTVLRYNQLVTGYGGGGDLYSFILQITHSLTDAKFQSTDLILHIFMAEIICYKPL